MTRRQLTIVVLAAFGALTQSDFADARERRRSGGNSEARVEQAQGNLPPGANIDVGRKELRNAPEAGAGSASRRLAPMAPAPTAAPFNRKERRSVTRQDCSALFTMFSFSMIFSFMRRAGHDRQ